MTNIWRGKQRKKSGPNVPEMVVGGRPLFGGESEAPVRTSEGDTNDGYRERMKGPEGSSGPAPQFSITLKQLKEGNSSRKDEFKKVPIFPHSVLEVTSVPAGLSMCVEAIVQFQGEFVKRISHRLALNRDLRVFGRSFIKPDAWKEFPRGGTKYETGVQKLAFIASTAPETMVYALMLWTAGMQSTVIGSRQKWPVWVQDAYRRVSFETFCSRLHVDELLQEELILLEVLVDLAVGDLLRAMLSYVFREIPDRSFSGRPPFQGGKTDKEMREKLIAIECVKYLQYMSYYVFLKYGIKYSSKDPLAQVKEETFDAWSCIVGQISRAHLSKVTNDVFEICRDVEEQDFSVIILTGCRYIRWNSMSGDGVSALRSYIKMIIQVCQSKSFSPHASFIDMITRVMERCNCTRPDSRPESFHLFSVEIAEVLDIAAKWLQRDETSLSCLKLCATIFARCPPAALNRSAQFLDKKVIPLAKYEDRFHKCCAYMVTILRGAYIPSEYGWLPSKSNEAHQSFATTNGLYAAPRMYKFSRISHSWWNISDFGRSFGSFSRDEEPVASRLMRVEMIAETLYFKKPFRIQMKHVDPLTELFLQAAAQNLKYIITYVIPSMLNDQVPEWRLIGLRVGRGMLEVTSGFALNAKRINVRRQSMTEKEFSDLMLSLKDVMASGAGKIAAVCVDKTSSYIAVSQIPPLISRDNSPEHNEMEEDDIALKMLLYFHHRSTESAPFILRWSGELSHVGRQELPGTDSSDTLRASDAVGSSQAATNRLGNDESNDNNVRTIYNLWRLMLAEPNLMDAASGMLFDDHKPRGITPQKNDAYTRLQVEVVLLLPHIINEEIHWSWNEFLSTCLISFHDEISEAASEAILAICDKRPTYVTLLTVSLLEYLLNMPPGELRNIFCIAGHVSILLDMWNKRIRLMGSKTIEENFKDIKPLAAAEANALTQICHNHPAIRVIALSVIRVASQIRHSLVWKFGESGFEMSTSALGSVSSSGVKKILQSAWDYVAESKRYQLTGKLSERSRSRKVPLQCSIVELATCDFIDTSLRWDHEKYVEGRHLIGSVDGGENDMLPGDSATWWTFSILEIGKQLSGHADTTFLQQLRLCLYNILIRFSGDAFTGIERTWLNLNALLLCTCACAVSQSDLGEVKLSRVPKKVLIQHMDSDYRHSRQKQLPGAKANLMLPSEIEVAAALKRGQLQHLPIRQNGSVTDEWDTLIAGGAKDELPLSQRISRVADADLIESDLREFLAASDFLASMLTEKKWEKVRGTSLKALSLVHWSAATTLLNALDNDAIPFSVKTQMMSFVAMRSDIQNVICLREDTTKVFVAHIIQIQNMLFVNDAPDLLMFTYEDLLNDVRIAEVKQIMITIFRKQNVLLSSYADLVSFVVSGIEANDDEGMHVGLTGDLQMTAFICLFIIFRALDDGNDDEPLRRKRSLVSQPKRQGRNVSIISMLSPTFLTNIMEDSGSKEDISFQKEKKEMRAKIGSTLAKLLSLTKGPAFEMWNTHGVEAIPTFLELERGGYSVLWSLLYADPRGLLSIFINESVKRSNPDRKTFYKALGDFFNRFRLRGDMYTHKEVHVDQALMDIVARYGPALLAVAMLKLGENDSDIQHISITLLHQLVPTVGKLYSGDDPVKGEYMIWTSSHRLTLPGKGHLLKIIRETAKTCGGNGIWKKIFKVMTETTRLLSSEEDPGLYAWCLEVLREWAHLVDVTKLKEKDTEDFFINMFTFSIDSISIEGSQSSNTPDFVLELWREIGSKHGQRQATMTLQFLVERLEVEYERTSSQVAVLAGIIMDLYRADPMTVLDYVSQRIMKSLIKSGGDRDSNSEMNGRIAMSFNLMSLDEAPVVNTSTPLDSYPSERKTAHLFQVLSLLMSEQHPQSKELLPRVLTMSFMLIDKTDANSRNSLHQEAREVMLSIIQSCTAEDAFGDITSKIIQMAHIISASKSGRVLWDDDLVGLDSGNERNEDTVDLIDFALEISKIMSHRIENFREKWGSHIIQWIVDDISTLLSCRALKLYAILNEPKDEQSVHAILQMGMAVLAQSRHDSELWENSLQSDDTTVNSHTHLLYVMEALAVTAASSSHFRTPIFWSAEACLRLPDAKRYAAALDMMDATLSGEVQIESFLQVFKRSEDSTKFWKYAISSSFAGLGPLLMRGLSRVSTQFKALKLIVISSLVPGLLVSKTDGFSDEDVSEVVLIAFCVPFIHSDIYDTSVKNESFFRALTACMRVISSFVAEKSSGRRRLSYSDLWRDMSSIIDDYQDGAFRASPDTFLTRCAGAVKGLPQKIQIELCGLLNFLAFNGPPSCRRSVSTFIYCILSQVDAIEIAQPLGDFLVNKSEQMQENDSLRRKINILAGSGALGAAGRHVPPLCQSMTQSLSSDKFEDKLRLISLAFERLKGVSHVLSNEILDDLVPIVEEGVAAAATAAGPEGDVTNIYRDTIHVQSMPVDLSPSQPLNLKAEEIHHGNGNGSALPAAPKGTGVQKLNFDYISDNSSNSSESDVSDAETSEDEMTSYTTSMDSDTEVETSEDEDDEMD